MAESDREQLGEWLSAYIDGELGPEETRQVEAFLREDAEARQTLDKLRRTVNLVSSLPRHPAPESVAQDVRAHVERAALLGDTPQAPAASGGRRSPALALLATAAAVALVFVGLRIMTGAPDLARQAAKPLALNPEKQPQPSDEEEPETTRAPKGRDAALARTESGILKMATFQQKLQTDADVALLREHRFANEPVRLAIRLKDESRQEAVAARLVSYLREHGAIDLADHSAEPESRELVAQGVVFPGVQGRNFAEPDQRQILVQATTRQLEGMLEDFERIADPDDQVVLTSGVFTVKGLRSSQAALYGVETPTAVAHATPRDELARDLWAEMDKTEEAELGASDDEALTSARSTTLLGGAVDELDRGLEAGPGGPTTKGGAAEPEATEPAGAFRAKATESRRVDTSAARPEATDGPARRRRVVHSGTPSVVESDSGVAAAGKLEEPAPKSSNGELRKDLRAPAATRRARRAGRSAREPSPSPVERTTRAPGDARRPPATSTDQRDFKDGAGETPTPTATVRREVATSAPNAETYITLVLQIEGSQPPRTEAANRAKKPARDAKRKTENGSVE
ncbi:MAG: zf-HC2 domain-containing protein [Phycisphaerae bacterium]